MPDPSNLAFLVAAIVAGIFTRTSALVNKDISLSNSKSKWLNDLKDGVSSFNAICVKANELQIISFMLQWGKGIDGQDIESFDHDEKMEKVAEEIREAMSDFNKSKSIVFMKLDKEEMLQKEIADKMNEVNNSINMYNELHDYIGDPESITENVKALSEEVMLNIKDLTDLMANLNKQKWRSIKSGDKHIKGKLKKYNKYIAYTVGFYVVYVLYYSFVKVSG